MHKEQSKSANSSNLHNQGMRERRENNKRIQGMKEDRDSEKLIVTNCGTKQTIPLPLTSTLSLPENYFRHP